MTTPRKLLSLFYRVRGSHSGRPVFAVSTNDYADLSLTKADGDGQKPFSFTSRLEARTTVRLLRKRGCTRVRLCPVRVWAAVKPLSATEQEDKEKAWQKTLRANHDYWMAVLEASANPGGY